MDNQVDVTLGLLEIGLVALNKEAGPGIIRASAKAGVNGLNRLMSQALLAKQKNNSVNGYLRERKDKLWE